MKTYLRLLFFSSVLFSSYSLSAQPNAPFLIQIKNLQLRNIGNPELEYLQVWTDALFISTPSSFPAHKIEGFKFFPLIKSADGTILYDGCIAPNGFSDVDTALISKIPNLLFSIPVEHLGGTAGTYNVQVELYSMHESGTPKYLIESKAHKLTIPKLDYISWTINSLKIPDSESYDTRFLFAKHISCNADLYVKIHRNSSEVFRSSSSDNTCYLHNVQCNGYTSAKATWRISAMDFDGTSFDDLVESFNIGRVEDGTEKEIKSGGSTLNYKVSTSAKPALNPYQYSIHSYFRKHDGVSGIAYSLRGPNLQKITAADFSLAHYAGQDKVTKPLALQQSSDSLVYFVPLHEYEPGSELRMQLNLDNNFTKGEMARYFAFQKHRIPDQIPDNEIKNISTSFEKIKGTMCLKISGSYVVPELYVKNGSIFGTCVLEGSRSKIDSIAFFQANAAFSFVIPAHTLDERKKSATLRIESYTYTQHENFPRKKRFFRSYVDTVENIKVELEDVSLRIFAKPNKKYVSTAKWSIADCFSNAVFSEKSIGETYTDFTVRKHKDDDVKLVLQYESEGVKKEELSISAEMLSTKGRKVKLKTLKGAGKVRVMRM